MTLSIQVVILFDFVCLTNTLITAKPVLNPFISPIKQTENSFYMFACSISSGFGQLTKFAWFRNGKPLLNNKEFIIEDSEQFSLLKLTQVKRTHSGNYSCVVKNDDGFDSTNVQLIVNGDHCF